MSVESTLSGYTREGNGSSPDFKSTRIQNGGDSYSTQSYTSTINYTNGSEKHQSTYKVVNGNVVKRQ